MTRQGIVVSVALLLAGCAQRDNPFDPVNLPLQRQGTDTAFVPIPHLFNLVLLPESSGRNSPYYGNIQSALTDVRAGDTLWIRGGEKYYSTFGTLNLKYGGSDLLPVVIRSFGGQALIRADTIHGEKSSSCLWIQQPFVKVVGLTFMNCGTGIFASSLDGPLTLDSVRIEFTEIALDFQRVSGVLKLHHVQLNSNVADPPFLFSRIDILDTLDFSWTPRAPSGI